MINLDLIQRNEVQMNRVLKKLSISLISLAVFAAFLEIGLRAVYFQVKARSPLAIVTTIRTVKTYYMRKLATQRTEELDLPPGLYDSLFSEKGSKLLSSFSVVYEDHFSRLVHEIKLNRAEMIVLYIPTVGYHTTHKKAHHYCKIFFKELCKKYRGSYLDVTTSFVPFKNEHLYFLPEDGHLTRFANFLIADTLASILSSKGDFRSDYKFQSRPELFGDLTPNHDEIWDYDPRLPYRVSTNSQGLRMNKDLSFPKKKQRILILGDSYTFGPYLNAPNTYPEILNKKFPEREFINAAKAGYTISDEVSLFLERGKYVEPDIII